VRTLIEEHAEGRCLLRVGTRLRPSFVGVIQSVALAVALVAITSAAIAVLRGPIVSMICAAVAGIILWRAAWQTTRAVTLIDRALGRVTLAAAMMPLPHLGAARGARLSLRPATSAQFLQAAVVTLLAVSGVVSGVEITHSVSARQAFQAAAAAAASRPAPQAPVAHGGVAIASAGDLFVADPSRKEIRRLRVRHADAVRTSAGAVTTTQQLVGTPVPFDAAADIALAGNGDIFVADPLNHRICRIDRPSGRVTTVAGTGGQGFDSEAKQAAQSPLRHPEAIAVGRNGDLYIADTRNNRIRVVSQLTGLIRTVAGDGEPTGRTPNGTPLGDGGPAVDAHLDSPTGVALAANGDIYISDTGHNRVRRVDAVTGIITTHALVDAPTGLALAPAGRRLVVYVIDSRHGVVKVVGVDGVAATLRNAARIQSPTRLAYHQSGWLYVKDSSPTGVTAVPVPNPARVELASVRHRAGPR